MPRFKYIAMNAAGEEVDGVINAENKSQALAMLRDQKVFPTKVVELGGGKQSEVVQATVQKKTLKNIGSIDLSRFFKGSVNQKQLTVFTRQLATLIDAGMPLLRSLRVLLKQEVKPAMREALTGMGEAVEGGSTFSEALSHYPKIFDKLFINMVKAGEAGGVLEVVLSRLAEFMEKSEKIKRKIKSAMIYPIVVLSAALGILVFLLVKVIPRFQEIFKSLIGPDATLPALTRFVIGASDFVKYHWLVLILVVAAITVGFIIIKKTEKGRKTLDRISIKLPLFGPLVRKTAVGRFTRTLGTLLHSGVAVLQALNIVKETSGNAIIAEAIQKVHDSVKEGDSMAMPLEASGVFPPMVVSMVDVGEETGALPEMLLKIADNYDDEVDAAVEGLTSAIEPVMIILLAVIIGGIVIAMFVPMIQIISNLS